MTVTLDPDRLFDACSDLSWEAGITIKTDLEPLAGHGAPVKPAVYAGGLYQLDERWDGRKEPPEAVRVVVIDNVPSQANRLEAALQTLRGALGLPEMVLDLSGFDLPPHLPKQLSSFQFPHRQADAYLRDATLDGQPFPRTPLGQSLFRATADNPVAILEWFPQAALYGFWQSHLGKKRSQAKLARSWVSEIVGYSPATTGTKALGLKGDPLNLSIDERAEYDPEDLIGGEPWKVVEGEKKGGGGRTKERLSELGHGQVPVNIAEAAPAAISFARIEQLSTVSFAGLRRIWAESGATGPGANAAARALLVAIGLAAHVAAFGRSFSLRSGCELRPASSIWTWVGDRPEPVGALSLDEAIDLARSCAVRAEAAGLPVGSRWPQEPLVLRPASNLAEAIRRTWPNRA
jgi:CRISPR-associated protein Csb1